MSTFFDEAARTWDTPEKVERSRVIARAIAEAVPLEPVWDALEYGCGTGQVTWHLADRLRHVTLADTSEGMLDVVRARLAEEPSPKFSVAKLDLSAEPAPPVTYDLVYSVMALHHIPDVSRVLDEFHATLKPGGWLAVADLDADPEGHFHGHDHDGHHGFDRDDLAAMMIASGFDEPTFTAATTITRGVDDAVPDTGRGGEHHGQGGDPGHHPNEASDQPFTRAFDVFLAVARRL
jgi:SAM-dependent methyltransferase